MVDKETMRLGTNEQFNDKTHPVPKIKFCRLVLTEQEERKRLDWYTQSGNWNIFGKDFHTNTHPPPTIDCGYPRYDLVVASKHPSNR